MESEITQNEVFALVLNRIKEKTDSLIHLKNNLGSLGLEGWFKVEVVAALGNTKYAVKKLNNLGPDVELVTGTKIELKADNGFYLTSYKNGALKYNCLCLFLTIGSNTKQIIKLKSDRSLSLTYETFSDGENEWMIGLVKPIV